MSDSEPRHLTLGNRGFLVFVAVLAIIIAAWSWLMLHGARMPGAQRVDELADYGFDLSVCLVPRERLIASGLPRDGLHPLTTPEILTRDDLEKFDRERRQMHVGTYLVDSDRVVGVDLGGEARAYPLATLNLHEIVNDTLGGVPIAVTYSPLCDSVVVFERRVAGQELEFGFSGLLYDSNLVLYDRRTDPADESLWSQLQFRAIAGPAAAADRALRILPAAVTTWGVWRKSHENTTVLAPDRARLRTYAKYNYRRYFDSDTLRYPVDRLPPGERFGLKDRILAIRAGPGWHVVGLDELVASANAAGVATVRIGGRDVSFACTSDPPTAWAVDPPDITAVHALWFAWYALHQPPSRSDPNMTSQTASTKCQYAAQYVTPAWRAGE